VKTNKIKIIILAVLCLQISSICCAGDDTVNKKRRYADNLDTVFNQNALVQAILQEDQVKADSLIILERADIKVSNAAGITTLMLASFKNQPQVVTTLLDFAIDIDAVDNNEGHSALMITILSEHLEIAKILIQAHANVNIATHEGATALLLAAGKGFSEIVALLIKAGADVNKQLKQGATALHIAVYGEHEDVVKQLIFAGADVAIADNAGKTPIDIATAKMKKIIKETSEEVDQLLFSYLDDCIS